MPDETSTIKQKTKWCQSGDINFLENSKQILNYIFEQIFLRDATQ